MKVLTPLFFGPLLFYIIYQQMTPAQKTAALLLAWITVNFIFIFNPQLSGMYLAFTNIAFYLAAMITFWDEDLN